jgi:type IV pilus assembly protein PilN
MMIRINLLPVRAVKKREMGRQILVLFAAMLVAALVGNYLWYSNREEERLANQARITQTQAKIDELQKVIGEVNNINARKAEVERKLAVLNDLRKGRSGPVRMMDALATAMPKKVWITGFTEARTNVSIVGVAVSHDDVAEMMRALQNVVWTPKGIGRLVEQRKDAKTSRVELSAFEAAIEEFPVGDVKPFFNNVELSGATQRDPSAVDFRLTLSANYTI